MQKKQVAILDVGSSEIRAYVGERGVNKTFVIKGQKFFNYEGYSDGEFFDVEEVKKVLLKAGEFIKSICKNNCTVYVGVPGDFTDLNVRVSQIAFDKKKKITERDIDSLYDAAFVMNKSKKTLINRSAIVYELDDCRRLANPVGVSSGILKGKLSFIACENYFIDILTEGLQSSGIHNIEFVSIPLAQAMYLVDAESRDRISVVVDIGYISTTFYVIHGDGLLYQKSFGFGGGYITAALSERFDLNFDDAEVLKRNCSLSRLTSFSDELIEAVNGNYYNMDEVKKCICYSLDALCEEISDCIESLSFNLPEYVPLMITGGGITFLRGAKEYLASRLGLTVEVLSSNVPLLDSPTKASALSLLDIALEQ